MEKKTIRAFGGAFVAYSFAGDVDNAIKIIEKFSPTPTDTIFLTHISLVLTKLGWTIGDPYDDDSPAMNFFNNFLKDGECKP